MNANNSKTIHTTIIFFTETKSLMWADKQIKLTREIIVCSNIGKTMHVSLHYEHRVVKINTSFEIKVKSENDFHLDSSH